MHLYLPVQRGADSGHNVWLKYIKTVQQLCGLRQVSYLQQT